MHIRDLHRYACNTGRDTTYDAFLSPIVRYWRLVTTANYCKIDCLVFGAKRRVVRSRYVCVVEVGDVCKCRRVVQWRVIGRDIRPLFPLLFDVARADRLFRPVFNDYHFSCIYYSFGSFRPSKTSVCSVARLSFHLLAILSRLSRYSRFVFSRFVLVISILSISIFATCILVIRVSSFDRVPLQ